LEASFGASSHGDVEGQLARCTEDFVLRFPYSDPPAELRGKDAVRPRLTQALAVFEFALTLTAVYDCLDPDLLIAEYTSQGRVTTTGKPYANAYVGIVRFRDGLICEQTEYYNPLPAMRALSAD
jgi:ketosteroid isomerase-like protein